MSNTAGSTSSTRAVIFGAFVLHMVAFFQLFVQTWGARGERYHVRKYRVADLMARTSEPTSDTRPSPA